MSRIRVWRVLVASIVSEVGVIAAVGGATVIYAWLTPTMTAEQYSELGERAGYYVAPAAGVVTTLVAVLWVGRALEADFVVHGLLVGAVSVALTLGFVFSARPEDRPMYIVAIVLRIVAGYAGGLMARRKAVARAHAPTPIPGAVQESAR